MKKLFLLGAALCTGVPIPVAAQNQLGVTYFNMGPLAYEDSAWVRSGNGGWDIGVYFTLDVGDPGGFYLTTTLAPSHLFVWAIRDDEPISRYSWRPGYHDPSTGEKDRHVERVFTWLLLDVGYHVDFEPFDLRPSVGVEWPIQNGYSFGAQVEAIPTVGLQLRREVTKGMDLSLWSKVAYKKAHDWTVFQDWSTPERGVADPKSRILFHVGASIGGFLLIKE